MMFGPPPPDDDAVARRRKRNREAMQRLRERQQRTISELRATAEALAATHAALLQQIDGDASGPAQKLRDARAQTLALVTENSRLQQEINERLRWEDHVALLLEYIQREEPPSLEPPSDAFSPFDLDAVSAPRLSEARAMELILLHRAKRKAFKRQWLRAAHPPFTSEFFGWSIQYFLQQPYWYHRFTKCFRGVSASEVSQRVWRNAQRLTSYRTRLPIQRIAQRINENAFVVARWDGPNGVHEGGVLFLLRFRVEEPNGTIVIGMLTLPGPGEEASEDEEPARASFDVCLCVKLKPWRDEASGAEHCRAEFSGRMPFGEPENEQLNALEMVISLSRWEEANAARAPAALVRS